MIRITFFFLLISLGLNTSALAQVKTGSIKMGITDFDMPDMEGDMGGQMKEMMSSMTMTMHFKPGYQVTEISMMGMMNMKQHYGDDGMMTQYMDMMGQKIMMKTPMNQQLEELKKLGVEVDNIQEMYDITYDKTDKKKVLGYDCYRANIKMDLGDIAQGEDIPEGMQEMNMEMYVTDALEMKQFSMQSLPGLKLEGTPLIFTIDMGMMKMTYEALEFDANPDPSVFEKPAGEYKEMSMEEMQKMGMGAGGFGF